jgi:pilus assembly protein CpaE
VENVARVVLALDAPEVMEEVMHFLDRTGFAHVVATADDPQQLVEAIRQLDPDAVVAAPGLVPAGGLNGRTILAVDTRESVASLRAAMRSGARGYFVWPDERDDLARAAAMAARSSPESGGRRALVIAVLAARGGAGATFLATHLAAAMARRGRKCVLVDMDPVFAELTTALGVPREEQVRTIAELTPLADELLPEHLDGVLWAHPTGFRALLAPEPEAASRLEPGHFRPPLGAVASVADVAVLHLSRSLDAFVRAGLAQSDRVLLVLTLDVLSFKDARRMLAIVEELELSERCDFVVNRSARAEIHPSDVRRAFGKAPLAVIPADADVPAAQDRGQLLGRRGRASRAIDRLARALLEAAS